MKINNLDIPGIGSNGKYVDKNNTAGQERAGTLLKSLIPNQLIEELQENVIKKAGLIPSDTDTGQIKKSLDIFLNNLNVELSGKINGLQDQVYSSLRGNIMGFAGDVNKIPTNALFCDGREISRTAYAKLFDKLGIAWGAGNGTTTFHIPDGRGGVLKGAGQSDKYTHNENRGGIGTYQDTAIRNITGSLSFEAGFGVVGVSGVTSGVFSKGLYRGGSITGVYSPASDLTFNASGSVSVGETNRDNNLAVNWIIFI